MGEVVPIVISVYDDRTFTFVTKTSPASRLILKAIGKEKGSSKNNQSKAGNITKAQIREIAEIKAVDMTAASIETAMKSIEGTARSMGVNVIN